MTVITITMPIEERDSELERLREVERLRAANERLRHALHYIIEYPRVRQHIGSELCQLADAALAVKEE